MKEQPERPIVRVGDVVAREYEWAQGEFVHLVVTEDLLEDYQRVVDAGLWKIVTKGGEK